MTMPLCTAPFHSVLIDTDKTVKPCCVYNKPLGDLNTTSIQDILSNNDYVKLRQQMIDNEWPDNCVGCKKTEDATGSSLRLQLYGAHRVPYHNNTDITFLEFSSSNLCNLVCVGCSPSFSSAWQNFRNEVPWWKNFRKTQGWDYEENEGWKDRPEWKHHPSMLDFANNFLNTIDLSKLTYISLKGGEPFLNKEIVTLLEHLDDIKVLSNIEIMITTNGTTVTDKILMLLGKAKHVIFNISIDGLGKLNQYIRFDPKNPEKSHTDEIKKNILRFTEVKNSEIKMITSIQAHNVFRIHELSTWWKEDIYPMLIDAGKYVYYPPYYSHFIFYPREVSVQVFSQETRVKLIKHYESLPSSHLYKDLIEFLRLPYLGNYHHNQFVKYTQALDKTRLDDFLDLVPEAEEEFRILN